MYPYKFTLPSQSSKDDLLFLGIGQEDALDIVRHAMVEQRGLFSTFCPRANKYIVKCDQSLQSVKTAYQEDHIFRVGDALRLQWAATHYAASLNKKDCLEILFEHFKPQQVDFLWRTPADIAISFGHDDLAYWIYEKYLRKSSQWDALLFDVVSGCYKNPCDTLKLALFTRKKLAWDTIGMSLKFEDFPSQNTGGYQPNWRNFVAESETAAHVAARERKIFEMAVLLEHGWTVDVENLEHKTPLQIANQNELNRTLKDKEYGPWLNCFEKLCQRVRIDGAGEGVETFMVKKASCLLETGNVDEIFEHLKEARACKLDEMYGFEEYKKCFLKLSTLWESKTTTEDNLCQLFICEAKKSVRSRRSNCLRQALKQADETMNTTKCGKRLLKRYADAVDMLKQWDDEEHQVAIKLEQTVEKEDIVILEGVLNEASALRCTSDSFKELFDTCKEKCIKWNDELRSILLACGLDKSFVTRYKEKICSCIKRLPEVRWSQITNIGVDNPATAKIVARKLQLRGDPGNIIDGSDELRTLLKKCDLMRHFEVLSLSGFLDLEDLIYEPDLSIFDEMMTPCELTRLSAALKSARKSLENEIKDK